jgi:hypothetical protein
MGQHDLWSHQRSLSKPIAGGIPRRSKAQKGSNMSTRQFWRRLMRLTGLRPKSTPHQRLADQLGHPAQRTPQEWASWRKATVSQVNELLSNRKGVVAARELSRAMLQDPENPIFQELMLEAMRLKLAKDAKAGQPDPWADLPDDLRKQALQFEGFQLYAEEVEKLLKHSGFSPVPAAPKGSTKSLK